MIDRDKRSSETAVIQAFKENREDDPLLLRILQSNQLIKHNYRYCISKHSICGLMGCEQIFAYVLVPNQVIYPKFCEKHRSEHQRRLFLKQHSKP